MAVGTGVDVSIGQGVLPAAKVMRWNSGNYYVVEDSSPLDPSDTTGGYGQITVDFPLDADSKRTMGLDLLLTDGSAGTTSGRIRGLSGDDLSVSVVANSRLGLLAVQRTIQPFVGTLQAGLAYLMGLCGISTGVVYDTWMSSYNVKLPGNRDNVFDYIQRMASAYDFEMSLVSTNVVFRSPRGRTAVNYRDANITWSLDQEGLARSVQGWAYNSWNGSDVAYPVDRLVDDAQVYQVDANETQVFEIPMHASLSAVDQPSVVSSVAIDDFSASVYAVTTSVDDTPMDPNEWTANGGKIVTKLSEDTRTLIITITGANLPELAPFRIAVPVGDNKYYSSLRVRGVGVFWNRTLTTLELGGSQDYAPDEVGTLVDSEFMETPDQLYHRLLRTAARYSGDHQTIEVTTPGINRLGDTGSAVYPTIGVYNALYGAGTIAAAQTALGPKISDWNSKLFALVSTDFTNQAFGNVAGARVLYDNCWYRIRSARIRMNEITYSAEADNTIGDVYRSGETIGQWNTRWTGRVIRDVNISPLLTDPTTSTGFGFGPFGSGPFGG